MHWEVMILASMHVCSHAQRGHDTRIHACVLACTGRSWYSHPSMCAHMHSSSCSSWNRVAASTYNQVLHTLLTPGLGMIPYCCVRLTMLSWSMPFWMSQEEKLLCYEETKTSLVGKTIFYLNTQVPLLCFWNVTHFDRNLGSWAWKLRFPARQLKEFIWGRVCFRAFIQAATGREGLKTFTTALLNWSTELMVSYQLLIHSPLDYCYLLWR